MKQSSSTPMSAEVKNPSAVGSKITSKRIPHKTVQTAGKGSIIILLD